MKHLRQSVILEIVGREGITSQEILRRRLRARGFDATQATISRDTKELGLVKRASDGAYQRPELEVSGAVGADAAVRRAVTEYVRKIDRVQQFVVVKTGPGQAQPLALAIDRAGLGGVVGTVAGDDTILVIVRNPRRAAALERRFAEWAVG